MKTEYNDIEKLIEKFLDGDTTNAEEKILYAFFRSHDIPSHLEKYKKEFVFYDKIIHGFPLEKIDVPPINRFTIYRRYIVGISIAACLAGFILLSLKTKNKEVSSVFEGSYIAYGNTVITDLKIIQPELEKDLTKILNKEKEINRILSKMEDINLLNIQNELNQE